MVWINNSKKVMGLVITNFKIKIQLYITVVSCSMKLSQIRERDIWQAIKEIKDEFPQEKELGTIGKYMIMKSNNKTFLLGYFRSLKSDLVKFEKNKSITFFYNQRGNSYVNEIDRQIMYLND